MNVPNEQNGANAIIGSVTKKIFYPNISKFPTLESYLGSTFYFKAPKTGILKIFRWKVHFFPAELIKKNLYVFLVVLCIIMTKLHSLLSS